MSDPTAPRHPDPDPAESLGDADAIPGELVSGGLLGGSDVGFDMGALLEQAMGMQQQLMEAQAQAAEEIVEGQSGGGAVRIHVTGGLDFRAVMIDPVAMAGADADLLGDLVLAALHDAMGRIEALQQTSVGGLDLGALTGMLGLGGTAGDDDDDEDEDGDEDADGGDVGRTP